MDSIQRAISIRQPWVELILRGEKTAEYRSRSTKIRERVYLYASLTPADSPEDWDRLGKLPGELPTGAIVGTVQIVDCQWDEDEECFAYSLGNPRRLAKALVPKNQPQPGFWRPQF